MKIYFFLRGIRVHIHHVRDANSVIFALTLFIPLGY